MIPIIFVQTAQSSQSSTYEGWHCVHPPDDVTMTNCITNSLVVYVLLNKRKKVMEGNFSHRINGAECGNTIPLHGKCKRNTLPWMAYLDIHHAHAVHLCVCFAMNLFILFELLWLGVFRVLKTEEVKFNFCYDF